MRHPVLRLLTFLIGLGLPAAALAQQPALDANMVRALGLREIGPAISSGRIVDLAVSPVDRDTIYVASASGGLWKSVNGGTTWEAVFEREGTVSIGAIAVSSSNPNVVWVGTGEANNQRSSSSGDGVYRSADGGKTWTHMGLRASQHIGAIAIHPGDETVVYVAALGALWGANEERGVFRTRDGGNTWEKVLYVSPNTGVVDIIMDPSDPERLYAGAYQRERRNWSFIGGGPEGGIYRSEDGGDTWEKLTNGLPDPDIGKIGFDISPLAPDTVYAIVQAQDDEQTGVYVSTDRGASWEHRNTLNPTPWYYSQIRVDPRDLDRVYVLGTMLSVSDDGGREFRDDGASDAVHVDHHALWIDPDDGDRMILGNDGGLYITRDRGAHWDFVNNLPVTQFYQMGVDMREPFYYVCGGTQDNNTWCGPSGTRNSDGIVNDDWYITVGGDGFYVQADPDDPDVLYTESQYGNIVRFNARTGERKRIQPQAPEGEEYRWNWSAPIVISRHDHSIIYFAANRVFRSTNQGDDWEVISPDLSRQLDVEELQLMGRNWPRNAVSRGEGTSEYGNVTTLDESPLEAGVLAAGTDDGLLQITRDGGANWTRIESVAGVRELTRVSRLQWSQHAAGRLYVVFDGQKDNNFVPMVRVSEDYGATWRDINGNLPSYGSTRVVREHPRNADLLAVGTEFGLFVSIDRGASWVEVDALPTVAVHDIIFHPRTNDMVVGTHGRGFWILDDVTLLEEVGGAAAAGAHLASVRAATQFNEFDRGRDSQGDRYFRADNPPRGAILTYWLSKETVAAPEGGSAPSVSLSIIDGAGNLVRRLEAGSDAGLHRTAWDLRHDPPYRAEPSQRGGFGFGGAPRGVRVLPGAYIARLAVGARHFDSEIQVLADPMIPVSAEALAERYRLAMQVSEMQGRARAVQNSAEAMEADLRAIRAALDESPGDHAELSDQARGLAGDVGKLLTDVRGSRGFPPDPSVPRGISMILGALSGQLDGYTGAPSDTERTFAEQGSTRLQAAVRRVNELRESLRQLNAGLDAAGIRWTPGREVRANE